MKRTSNLSKMLRSFVPALSIALAVMAFSSAANAQIFYSSVLVSADSGVLNVGKTVIAYDVSGTSTTVNGVHFSSSTTNGTVTFGFSGFPDADNNGVDPAYVSTELGNALINNIFNVGASATLTFNHLTPGLNYELQLFAGTTGVGDGSTQLTDGTASGLLSFGNSNPNSTAYYTNELFRAPLSGTETITMSPSGPGDDSFVILDAANLRVIPEPSTYALVFGGLVALLFVRRFRSKRS